MQPRFLSQLSPAQISEANHPCTLLIMTKSATSLTKQPVYLVDSLTAQTIAQSTAIMTRQTSNAPIMRSQFISPRANVQLMREGQKVQAGISLRGTLYMNEKLVKSNPCTKEYMSRLIAQGQSENSTRPKICMQWMYYTKITQMYLSCMSRITPVTVNKAVPMRKYCGMLSQKKYLSMPGELDVELATEIQQMMLLKERRLSTKRTWKLLELARLLAFMLATYSTIEELEITALVMLSSWVCCNRRRLPVSGMGLMMLSLWVTVVISRLMKEGQVVLRDSSCAGSMPSLRGIVNLIVLAFSNQQVMLRGNPPGSTQLAPSALTSQNWGHWDTHTFSKLNMPIMHFWQAQVTLLASYPLGHTLTQVWSQSQKLLVANWHEVQQVGLSSHWQQLASQKQHRPRSYTKQGYWPIGHAITQVLFVKAAVWLTQKQPTMHLVHSLAPGPVMHALQVLWHGTQLTPTTTQPQGHSQVCSWQFQRQVLGQSQQHWVPKRKDSCRPEEVQLVQVRASLQYMHLGSQNQQQFGVAVVTRYWPRGHVPAGMQCLNFASRMNPAAQAWQVLREVQARQFVTQLAITHLRSPNPMQLFQLLSFLLMIISTSLELYGQNLVVKSQKFQPVGDSCIDPILICSVQVQLIANSKLGQYDRPESTYISIWHLSPQQALVMLMRPNCVLSTYMQFQVQVPIVKSADEMETWMDWLQMDLGFRVQAVAEAGVARQNSVLHCRQVTGDRVQPAGVAQHSEMHWPMVEGISSKSAKSIFINNLLSIIQINYEANLGQYHFSGSRASPVVFLFIFLNCLTMVIFQSVSLIFLAASYFLFCFSSIQIIQTLSSWYTSDGVPSESSTYSNLKYYYLLSEVGSALSFFPFFFFLFFFLAAFEVDSDFYEAATYSSANYYSSTFFTSLHVGTYMGVWGFGCWGIFSYICQTLDLTMLKLCFRFTYLLVNAASRCQMSLI